MVIERYEHHGKVVAVQSELKGKHRVHCICFICDKFKPGAADHCPIARKVYKTCVEHGIVSPVYECPDFAIVS
jgi:hypothetical protein